VRRKPPERRIIGDSAISAAIERSSRIWPTVKPATSHLPRVSLSEKRNMPTSISRMPPAVP
jgi:hypothetical protein